MEEVSRQIRARGASKPRKIPPISQCEFRLAQQAFRRLWRGEALSVLPGVEPRLSLHQQGCHRLRRRDRSVTVVTRVRTGSLDLGVP